MTRVNAIKIVYLAVFACLALTFSCHAQETITITTYYPSPDGVYNNLSANFFQADRIAVGDTNNPAALPNGVLNILPLGAAPAGNSGSIYYDGNANVLNYFNGTIWFPIQPATLVAYAGGNMSCIPVGTHVVAVMDVNRRSASMAPCDVVSGADPYLVGTVGGIGRVPDAQGDLYVTGSSCIPRSGFIVCH